MMCDECRQIPCHPRCPNFEPTIVHFCPSCLEGLEAGDEVFFVLDEKLCHTCAHDWLHDQREVLGDDEL